MLSRGIRFKQRVKDVLGRVANLGGVYTRRFGTHMTVVAFHRVTDELAVDGITCGSADFEAFCIFFARHFRVLSLSDQLAAGRDLGGTLSITFDDGYRDNAEVAAPILRKLGLPATFFVTTGFIGSRVVPPWDQHLPRQPGWMTWDQVRSLSAQGFEIGGHTDTHLDLARADPEIARADLAASRRKLADALGAPGRLFAYPFGGREHITAAARELVRESGFICCAASYGGVNPPTPDPFNLRRIAIAEWFHSPHQFGFELATGRT